ncbi:hydroxymethylbilane synthase [Planctomicrobium sp. SH661]|uniref:hydroxymethylbilane synthase n=1 Tax=Planctomicrobium sp. SH661 TaxID=3448124 RepID=UPI003F5C7AC7
MMNQTGSRCLKIATRESQLALWQANYVANELRRVAPEWTVELAPMSTIGDRNRVDALKSMGGQGVFTREVQRAVLDRHADLAVHSLKDLPTVPTAGLTLAGIPPRAPRFDALLLPHGKEGDFDSLPQGAKIGTGSPRRQSQLLRLRPDLQLLEIRGNVETRIAKLDAGQYDAIILAEAGLRRLDLHARISQILAPPILYPAVGQAALGIECRDDDLDLQEVLSRLTDPLTSAEVRAERACLFTLQAGCHAPVGLVSTINGEKLTLEVLVLSPDGKQCFRVIEEGVVQSPEELGQQAAKNLIEQGAAAVL